MDIEKIILENNLSKRDLASFKKIVNEVQPLNNELIIKLDSYINTNISDENFELMDLTINSLLEALDYPTEGWAIKTENQLNGYIYLKDAIIEYAFTPFKNMDTVLDNVAFINGTNKGIVNNTIIDYIVNYGDPKKIQNAFKMYSTNYENAIYNSTKPSAFIPIYAKAVTSKFAEITKNESKQESFKL